MFGFLKNNRQKEFIDHISFEVSTKCNLNCKYCYNVWKAPDSDKPSEVSFKLVKKTIKRLFRSANIQQFTFTGGEPLLFERLIELVLFVRLKSCSVSVITNGNAGTDDDFLTLIKLGVQLFELPFHSDDSQIHDYLAGVDGAHAKSASRIKFLIENGASVVAVIVLTKHNIETLKGTISELKKIGVRSIMLNRFNIGGMGISCCNDLMPSLEDLRRAFSIANSASVEIGIRITSNVCTPICVLNPDDYQNIWFGHCGSDPKRKPLTIDHCGNLRLCNHSPVNAGNIFKNSFPEIFESDYVQSWNTCKPDFCDTCDKYLKCFAGCRAASEQMGNSLNCEDPIIKIMNICKLK